MNPLAPRFLLTALVVLAAFSVLIGLGVWQLERLAWKEDLIAKAQARLTAPAIPLPAAEALSPDDREFAHVTATGTFDHAAERDVFSPSGEGPVYRVVTPLDLGEGTFLLVDRGYVPDRLRDAATRAEGNPSGPVTVTGWLRTAESRSFFTPEDAPGENLFFARDPQRLAQGLPGRPWGPVVLVADETAHPGGWPKGGMTLDFTNNHLGYAFTWFGLAGALAAMAGVALWRAIAR